MANLHIIGNASSSPPALGACSSYLVVDGGTRLLLDCGPGAVPQLMAVASPYDLDAIVISHMHTDHFLDLLTLNMALLSGKEAGVAYPKLPIPLILPPGALETLDGCFAALARGVTGTLASRWRESYAAREHDGGETVEVGPLRITFVGPMKHATTCYGVRVQSSTGVLGYTGDTAYCEAAVAVGKDADLLLSECTLMEFDAPRSATHLSAPELGRIAREAGCKHVLATHISRQDDDWRAGLAARIRSEFAGEVTVVRNGDGFRF